MEEIFRKQYSNNMDMIMESYRGSLTVVIELIDLFIACAPVSELN